MDKRPRSLSALDCHVRVVSWREVKCAVTTKVPRAKSGGPEDREHVARRVEALRVYLTAATLARAIAHPGRDVAREETTVRRFAAGAFVGPGAGAAPHVASARWHPTGTREVEDQQTLRAQRRVCFFDKASERIGRAR